jgi:hypothetical protein
MIRDRHGRSLKRLVRLLRFSFWVWLPAGFASGNGSFSNRSRARSARFLNLTAIFDPAGRPGACDRQGRDQRGRISCASRFHIKRRILDIAERFRSDMTAAGAERAQHDP